MAGFSLKMPKLGESITEATIIRWLKNVGDRIEMDEPILEIATDKVDSEIPSPVEGVLKERLFNEGDVVAVETIIAIIETETGSAGDQVAQTPLLQATGSDQNQEAATTGNYDNLQSKALKGRDTAGRFYSPLVRTVAKKEKLTVDELEKIPGSGHLNRLTIKDLKAYMSNRSYQGTPVSLPTPAIKKPIPVPTNEEPDSIVSVGGDDTVIEMSRMRKLIADHMVMSEATSVHITLFAEADVTNLVNWRNQQKDQFEKHEGGKLTYTPVFIEAISKALRDYPMVNVSVDGNKIIVRKNVNIGMAVATPDGNLIVPVIKNADHMSLLGLAIKVNDLATRARINQLKPDEIQGGTFTLTNFGTFGALGGTPIINQPQVAILGVGLIQKKPVVIETPQGDTIGIRHIIMLSLSCDHRVVDGALGSQFMKRVASYLEEFDNSRVL
ncbi:MAG TPA: dihydrolipoamide acetyltransferase family protein [Bacteroidales bacterium]|nr:dihydrolipoamide acetyltransferase family protein [Bacteroidales bacterium]